MTHTGVDMQPHHRTSFFPISSSNNFHLPPDSLIKEHYFTCEKSDLGTDLGNCPLVTMRFPLLTKLFLVRNRNYILKKEHQ